MHHKERDFLSKALLPPKVFFYDGIKLAWVVILRLQRVRQKNKHAKDNYNFFHS